MASEPEFDLRAVGYWTDKRVVVTGGAGFLGSHVVKKLIAADCESVVVPRSKDFDLTREGDVAALYGETSPDVVLHLAASVGGIGANQRHPGIYFYENLMMGLLLMEQARQHEVEKFVGIGSVCAYPKFASVPFKEKDIWEGYPEETNAPYGLAKKMMMVQTQAYAQEYGFNSIHLLMTNLYGPGDDFDPGTSHVIPALIRRATEARDKADPELIVWGDGSPTREFLYVDDAAEGILLAAERYNSADPVNLGSGKEISIRELAETVCVCVGFEGQLKWDTSRPNGQPRRCLDVSQAERLFGFRASTSFPTGLARTVEWYGSSVG